MQTRHLLSLLLLPVALLGCKATKTVTIDNTILVSAKPFVIQAVETREEVFNLNEDIQQQLDVYFQDGAIGLKRAKQLLRFLVASGDKSMSYQSGANLTANQTYRNMNANCLSLSILAHAISRHLGLHTQFQRVHIPEYWDQSRGYSLLTGHVNVRVSEVDNTRYAIKTLYVKPATVTIDFDPNSRGRDFATTPISTDTILAMFYNNKGAMAMINEQLDLAFSYYRATIKVDPHHDGAWGNLGILYRISGQYELAERAYNQALAINNDNRNAMGNLAKLYYLTDRQAEAERLEYQIHVARKSNPYYMLVLGDEAFKKGEMKQAKHYYSQAKALDKRLHGSYFGLAKVAYVAGELDKAEYLLERAHNVAEFSHDKRIYEGKLAMLKGVARHQVELPASH
ncbi:MULTISPECIES: tetratricopeptide repeat protein [unclassified Pseudoalteromonas]|uniref:tetratricopeptide repeat protein n=1 Tax=unclassified Pseudoalteromonas TaxID=194690 RepID=UPI003014D5EB